MAQPDANARGRAADKLDPGTFECSPDLFNGHELRTDRAAHSFQTANRRDADTGLHRKLVLLPSDERTRGFDLARPHQHLLYRASVGRDVPRFRQVGDLFTRFFDDLRIGLFLHERLAAILGNEAQSGGEGEDEHCPAGGFR